MRSILKATLAALAIAHSAVGHTWIEQLRNVNSNGSYVGEYGYPRGMVSKTDPGFSGFSMNWELPGDKTPGNVFVGNSTPLCHTAQTKQVQSSDKYPRLKATPGGFIAMRFTENGHVTEPFGRMAGKPDKGGSIFVYGTTSPKEDEKLLTVQKWTKDGKGGDGRGVLLAIQNYDDGRCYEINDTPVYKERTKTDPNYAMGQAVEGAPGNFPLQCETNVQLPKTAEKGKAYTLYWVWQWPSAPGKDPSYPKGKDEYYTTCMDVDVVSVDVASTKAQAKFAMGQQDAMAVAVEGWASRTALVTDIVRGAGGQTIGAAPTGAPSATNGSPTSSATSKAPIAPTGAPFHNSTRTASAGIPTLTKRPTVLPTKLPGVVTVTDTVVITVTAPAATQVPSSATATPGMAHSIRYPHGAKFRGRFT